MVISTLFIRKVCFMNVNGVNEREREKERTHKEIISGTYLPTYIVECVLHCACISVSGVGEIKREREW